VTLVGDNTNKGGKMYLAVMARNEAIPELCQSMYRYFFYWSTQRNPAP